MALWVILVILAVVGAVYSLLPKKKPTIDIKKFPRKYPDEKVRNFSS
jgi:hypothetical protein